MKSPPLTDVVPRVASSLSNVQKHRSESFKGKVRRLNARQVERILKRYGFKLVKRKGKGKASHHKWRNFGTKRLAMVPYHGNESIAIGTLCDK